MNTNEAIKVAIKCKHCANASAYKCSLVGCENCENDYDAKEYMEMLDVFIDKYEKVKDLHERKVKDLYERYVDACSICTTFNCDECYLGIVIKDLEEILNTIEGDNNV